MPEKRLTKTDVEKKAIVVTRSMRTLLAKHGIQPSIRGDGATINAIRIYFVNRARLIHVNYYAAQRKTLRVPEPRCWATAFNDLASEGSLFSIEHVGTRLEMKIT